METNAYQAPGVEEPSAKRGYTGQGFLLLVNVVTFSMYCIAWTLNLIASGLRLNVYVARIPSWLLQASDATAPWTVVGFYLCALTFAIFSFRASKNARALGLELRFPAGATLYYHVVPLLNLFMPFRVMRDLREASNPESRERYLKLWWGAYLLARLSVIYTRVWLVTEDGQKSFRAVTTQDFFIGVPAVVSGCLSVFLLYDIHRGQSALAAAQGLDK
ncbi:MAG: DUF4328 domain-containing protein [Polyangiaceae bacterium]